MTRQIFINLPVKDLNASKTFFGALGFGFNPEFTNDQGACMVVSDTIHVMLLREESFKTFTHKQICDAAKSTEVLVCLSCDSRAEVDETVARARKAGGNVPREPQDHGFMYGHSFEDLDGHIWEFIHMQAVA